MDQTRAKTIRELFVEIKLSCSEEENNIQVCGVTDDSRQVRPGMLFVAVTGITVDGHRFIADAVANGCVAVLASRDFGGECPVPLLRIDDTGGALGYLAAAFYDYPCRRMKMIGVTGTNGKTTSTYLLEGMIHDAGGIPGIIGTVSVRYKGSESPASLTTPQPVELQRTLWRMHQAGITHVAMEVSSHALAMQRINGVWFDVVLFTNITRDHLDFHGSMEEYFSQKEKLFASHLKRDGKGVVMLDGNPGEVDGESEAWGDRLVRVLAEGNHPVITCGIGKGLIRSRKFQFDLQGIRAEIVAAEEEYLLNSPLVGLFNLKNLLGAIGCGKALGYDLPTACKGVERVRGVPGRLERVTVNGEAESQAAGLATVFVDYAHTPDALENVLLTLRALEPARLIVVFGCGGDRDKGKRPLMGAVAARFADVLLVTSDNPRSESPQRILEEIEDGIRGEKLSKVQGELLMRGPFRKGYDIVEERGEAIRIAIRGAGKGDVVLISGKGHECYQIVGNRKLFFDDRQQAKEQLNMARQAA
ncbi:MAG: UDP-N-acetylmuramoyl-L-alanyl-D-glutamate--2,6-diaminopimelate ligase [Deltaproteobacteria bacterium]|nr:UDP-N-acetylmuramoyl-L-alanyl-D-glutamate--2,6-diaminopimelate ligase [Deltaproteobacteria bacterium]